VAGVLSERGRRAAVAFVAGVIIGPLAIHFFHIVFSSTKEAEALSAIEGMIGCVAGLAGVIIAAVTLHTVRKSPTSNISCSLDRAAPSAAANGSAPMARTNDPIDGLIHTEGNQLLER